jgi:hypothetical protein
MTINPPSNIKLCRRSAELSRIGNRAVKAAQEESRRLGVPNFYSRNGEIYYDQPSRQKNQKR